MNSYRHKINKRLSAMKKIVMADTVLMVHKTPEEIQKFISVNGFTPKKTKDGVEYLIRDENVDEDDVRN